MQRSDLVLELSGTLDANGTYQTDWVDSSGINSIRIASQFLWTVQQSTDTVSFFGNVEPGNTDTTETFIAARYFRLTVPSAQANINAPFNLSVRRAS